MQFYLKWLLLIHMVDLMSDRGVVGEQHMVPKN
jgi:hypothetical protein